MAGKFVRASKYRHVAGHGTSKKEECYDDIKVSKISWDSPFCAVNPKFLAVIIDSAGGGSFIVIPLEKVSGKYFDPTFCWQFRCLSS